MFPDFYFPRRKLPLIRENFQFLKQTLHILDRFKQYYTYIHFIYINIYILGMDRILNWPDIQTFDKKKNLDIRSVPII